MRWSDLPPQHGLGFTSWVFSLLLLFLPTAVLGLLAYQSDSLAVALGAGVQAMFFLVFLRTHPVWRPPISVSVVILYLIALVWAWVPLRSSTDWPPHVAQGVLLFFAVALFAVHDLTRTGAESLRRANIWSRRIAKRQEWPVELSDCRLVPEAIALREAVRDEPGAALSLLSDPRPEVQVAALGALEHRPRWRPGEAELVLKVGRESLEPAVRAATTYALASVDRSELVTGLAHFLGDPALEVRRAAAEALMWSADARWPFAREVVKATMADPKLANDGPLFVGIGRLPAAAVADLITWSSEHAPLARRAILTVIEHFHNSLTAEERPELGVELAAMVLNNETAPALRVELAALLRDHHLLTPDLLDRLTNLDQPAPMRLFAAELMLRINPHDPDGVDVLRGLARQPNRELAVQVGAVLQGVLGLEVGLPAGDLPAPNSKQAADVARRVLAWANGGTPDLLRPTPGPRPGLRGSRPAMKSVGSRVSMPGLPPTTPPPAGPSISPRNLKVEPIPAVPTSTPIDESLLAPPTTPLNDSLLTPPRGPMGISSRSSLDDSLITPPMGNCPLDESLLSSDDDVLTPPPDWSKPKKTSDSSAVI